MKKIPCVFQRDFSDKRNPKILDLVTPGCEWVLAGEGVATRKRDGTACLVRDWNLYKRYDAKKGKDPLPHFIPAQDPDPVTGHWPGWYPVDVSTPDPADVWHALAWAQTVIVGHLGKIAPSYLPNGTYELCGPRVNSNHENLDRYSFFRHGSEEVLTPGAERTFEGLRALLEHREMEGIVFWRNPGNPDSDMAKLTRENFGFAWPLEKS